MRLSGLVIASVCGAACLFPAARAVAQYQAPSDKLLLNGKTAYTWTQGTTDVLQLEGPVKIVTDRATLSADRAVVWITPEGGPDADRRRVQVALLGGAKVEQPGSTRSGERLIVTTLVAGKIQLTADDRIPQDRHDSAQYLAADALRAPTPAAPGAEPAAGAPPPQTARPTPTVPFAEAPAPGTPLPAPPPPTAQRPAGARPATRAAGGPAATKPTTARAAVPVSFEATDLQTVDTSEGTVATVLTGGVKLRQQHPNGDFIVLLADRVVLFTNLASLRDVQKSGGAKHGSDTFTAAYLEGDVRITFTPLRFPNNEQRLEARRVYYEFATDRAILTDAVIHTVNPQPPIPVIMRAKIVRQLAEGEYNAQKVELSTSAFAVPSYSIAADRIYVRTDPGNEIETPEIRFEARDATFRAFGTPIFYLPYAAGTMTDEESVLRGIGFEHSSAFGFGALTEWGLFPVLGLPAPHDLDLTFRADYYTDRGPATGLNGRYQGGYITDTTKQPWSFDGQFESYFVYDHGFDDIGRPLPRDEKGGSSLRGQALWEHQQFFPDDWQVQLRAGYVTDPTFLEQWFPRRLDTELPHDVSAYVKHQHDTEALTLLLQAQPSHLVTSSDLYQEQFEVEHLPEIGYRRIGDSLADDRLTFFSENTFDGLHFQHTRATLAQQGFYPYLPPGLPSLGTTGITDTTVYRTDFREEFDYPINAGRFKVVPYLVGRYTSYSDSPTGGAQNRFFGAAGARLSTQFWKVDDTVESELWDLHRMRHIIEPEVNLFTSAQTVDRSNVFVFEERNDPINDVSAAQVALRQRWQTYRGGPGRWRSVDVFTLDLEGDFFANQPSRDQLRPLGFRGLYFPSLPEVSVPRNAANASATWRISDNTVLLADAQENLDKTRLATASIGVVVRRDERLDYYIGNRYIADLHSNISTVAMDYQISPKYTFSFSQSFDFELGTNVESYVAVTRRFDSFVMIFRAFHNESTDQNGIGFNIVPNGVGYGLNSDSFQSAVTERR